MIDLALEADLCDQLYRSRYWAIKILGMQDADDALQDACVSTIVALRERDVLDPEAYVNGILHHIVMRGLHPIVSDRRYLSKFEPSQRIRDLKLNPEQSASANERLAYMRDEIGKLLPRYREILERGYLAGESRLVTQAAMGLSKHQYALLKNRAKVLISEMAGEDRKRDQIRQARIRAEAARKG